MGQPIDKITLKGFKSIRNLEDFPLRPLNILIGANGAGKSNFVSFFTFLREAVEGRLALYVAKKGGGDGHLYMGPKVTHEISAHLHFRPLGYGFHLEPTTDNSLVFSEEHYELDLAKGGSINPPIGKKGHREPQLKYWAEKAADPTVPRSIYDSVSGWTVYHFHDTRSC
ncbi:MAG: AAA family ATPase [Planctomycetes bacterium]|nr:AAA family ATPase [Planctomycetota bacterium]